MKFLQENTNNVFIAGNSYRIQPLYMRWMLDSVQKLFCIVYNMHRFFQVTYDDCIILDCILWLVVTLVKCLPWYLLHNDHLVCVYWFISVWSLPPVLVPSFQVSNILVQYLEYLKICVEVTRLAICLKGSQLATFRP